MPHAKRSALESRHGPGRAKSLRSNLYEDFLAFVRRHELFAPGERVIVAVSGGPDSSALFDILKRFSARGRIKLFACHLDHRLRGADSTADAAFVKKLAAKMRVPVTVARRDVARLARTKRLTIEAAARAARYEFFLRAAKEFNCTKVATAHTMSDNAETILQRLVEGAGPEGLSGIPVSRPLDPHGKITVVRPLLFAPRAKIEKYLAKRGLDSRLDKTNLEPIHFRNRIRLEILPRLKELNPSVEETISRSGANMKALVEIAAATVDDAYSHIVSASPQGVTLDVGALLSAPDALARETTRRALACAVASSRTVTSTAVDAVYSLARGRLPSASIALAANVVATRDYGHITIRAGGKNAPPDVSARKPSCDRATARGGRAEMGGRRVVSKYLAIPGHVTLTRGAGTVEARPLKRLNLSEFLAAKSAAEEVIDASAIAGRLVVRFALPGERFTPLGSAGTRKLQDFFTDIKVPRTARPIVPVVADDQGIIWVCGYRIADRARVTGGTKTLVYLALRRP